MAELRVVANEQTPAAETPATDALAEFFSNFSGGGYRFLIYRRAPKTWMIGGVAKEIEGHLETTDEVPTPDYLKDCWGGGTYLVQVQAPATDGKGGYRYVTSKVVKIAGDPKLRQQDYEATQPAAPATDGRPTLSDRLVEKSVERTFVDKERLEERLERERRERLDAERARLTAEMDRKQDPAVWQATVGAIQASAESQVVTLREQLARRDAEVAELRKEVVGRSPFGDPQILQLLLGRNQDEHTRIAENYRRELDSERRDREQTIALIERMHRSEIDQLKASFDAAMTSRDREITRLEHELAEARLSSRPTDVVAEMERMRKVLELAQGFAPGGQGDATPSVWETILDRFAPVLSNLTTPRGPAMLPGRPTQHALPGRPMMRALPPSAPQQPIAPPMQAPAPPPPAAVEGAMQALTFLESALRAGTPAAEVARSSLSLFPKSGIEAVAALEPAQAFGELERLAGPDHVLLSPAGRAFMHELLPALKAELARA